MILLVCNEKYNIRNTGIDSTFLYFSGNAEPKVARAG